MPDSAVQKITTWGGVTINLDKKINKILKMKNST